MKIYSAIQPNKLLHLVQRFSDLENLSTSEGLGRINVAPETEFLQLAALKLDNGKTFKAHKHIYKDGEKQVIAQESWVVVRGIVKAFFYDLDDTLLTTVTLRGGDASMTFGGGHNYQSQADDTLVYEYKTGPYKGIENDKEFI